MNEAEFLINKLMAHYGVGKQEELASLLGTTQSVISGWKNRNSIKPILKMIREKNILEDDEEVQKITMPAFHFKGTGNTQTGLS